MHQLDVLNTNLRDKIGERPHEEKEVKKSKGSEVDAVVASLALALACGGIGIFLFKTLPRN